MSIYYWDNKILFVNGKIAMNVACCCGGGGGCDYDLIGSVTTDFPWTVTRGDSTVYTFDETLPNPPYPQTDGNTFLVEFTPDNPFPGESYVGFGAVYGQDICVTYGGVSETVAAGNTLLFYLKNYSSPMLITVTCGACV